MKPTVKTSTTPIFLLYVVFRFQTPFTGINKMIMSVIVLHRPLAFNREATFTHFPATDLFHIRSLGVHSQIFAAVVAK